MLIFDWDVHHGNGTNAIFHERDDVLFCSIHQSPLYPGTGPASDVGRGDGEGFTVNLPVPGGSGDDIFLSHVEHVVRPLARAYAPDLLLISAGYDAHADDPLAGCRVTDAGFAGDGGVDARAAPTSSTSRWASCSRAATSWARCRARWWRRWRSPGRRRRRTVPEVAVHPLALRAQERLAAYWPALA